MGKERKKERKSVGVLVSRFGLSLGRLARLSLNSYTDGTERKRRKKAKKTPSFDERKEARGDVDEIGRGKETTNGLFFSSYSL